MAFWYGPAGDVRLGRGEGERQEAAAVLDERGKGDAAGTQLIFATKNLTTLERKRGRS